MKRIKLSEYIISVLTENMRFTSLSDILPYEMKVCRIVKFIQNNYRRRKHKPYLNKEQKEHAEWHKKQCDKIFSGKSMVKLINERKLK